MNLSKSYKKKEFNSNESLNSIESFETRSVSIDSVNEFEFSQTIDFNNKVPKEKLRSSKWIPIQKRRSREEKETISKSPSVEDVLKKLNIKVRIQK
tara:strand:- start:22324 stop:22611 length:288 start_codon:yes stop_codon:yes gene_type:complete